MRVSFYSGVWVDVAGNGATVRGLGVGIRYATFDCVSCFVCVSQTYRSRYARRGLECYLVFFLVILGHVDLRRFW